MAKRVRIFMVLATVINYLPPCQLDPNFHAYDAHQNDFGRKYNLRYVPQMPTKSIVKS